MLVAILRAVLQQPHSRDVCDALCDLLVAFAPSHMHAIQDTLLDMFEPGCPPHITVFSALESLCNSVPLLVPATTLQRVHVLLQGLMNTCNPFFQVLHCITPLFSVLTDALVKRHCLQLFGAIACAVRANTACDGKLRLCVKA